MIRPRLRALGVATVILASTAASEVTHALAGGGGALSLAMAIAFILASAVDIFSAHRLRLPGLRRVLPERLAVSKAAEVEVTLENPHGFALRLEYSERLGAVGAMAVEMQGLPRRVRVPPRHCARFTYQLRPLKRGAFTLADCGLYVTGPLGLWEVCRRPPMPQRMRVGPDINGLEQLARQFAAPSSPPDITRPTRPLELVIWLDTGPTMQSGAAGARALDYATDAALALGFAARASGTPVGVHLNAGTGIRQLAASADERQLHELYRLLDGLQPSLEPIDFAAEGARLSAVPAGATFIILMTRLSTDSAALVGPLNTLGRRHRLLILDIIGELPSRPQSHTLHTEADAWAYCRAMHIAGTHQHAAWQLARHGLEVLQAPGSTLASEAVSRFTAVRSQPGYD